MLQLTCFVRSHDGFVSVCRGTFFTFVNMMFINGCLTYIISYNVLQQEGGYLMYIGVTLLGFFSIPVTFMLLYTVSLITTYKNGSCISNDLSFQIRLIFGNLTTNERANYRRYRHFRDGHGNYRNPFNRGVFYNVLEYFHVVEPPYVKKPGRASFIA